MKKDKYHKVTQLDPDLWAIEDIKSSEHSISYLLCGQSKALVFDTGLGISPVSTLVGQITNLPLCVYLSHWHFDHSGGAYEFEQVNGWESGQMTIAGQNGVDETVINSQSGATFLRSIERESYRTRAFPKVRMIRREQVLDLGGYKLEVLHTPGHTADSICLYEARKKWLFSGDTAYPGPIYLQFKDSSASQYDDSIKRLVKLDIKTIYPGHNTPRTSKCLLLELTKLLDDTAYQSKVYPRLSILKAIA